MMVGVLLAAGASTRMGSPKPLVLTRGGSFLARGIRHLWGACDQVIVVLGSNGKRIRESVEREFTGLVERGELHQELLAAHRHGAEGLEVHFIENPGWRHGMYASARVGLRAAVRAKIVAASDVLYEDMEAVRELERFLQQAVALRMTR